MKTLLIMRHGKSDWGAEYASDLDRPLAKRGKRQSAEMGAACLKAGLVPDLIISSPAKRARATAKRFAKAAEYSGELLIHDALYHEGVEGIMSGVLRQLDDDVEIAMIVGHNPTFEELAAHLTREGVSLPTATIAQVALRVEGWGAVREGCGKLVAILSPQAGE